MGSSAAKNPDPYGFLAAQAAQSTATNNLQAAGAATDANRVNQYTPYGSLVYDKTNKFNSDAYNTDLAAYNAQVKGIRDGTDTSPTAQYMRASGTLPTDPHLNPNDPKYNQVVWNSTTTLNPTAQAALDSQQNVNLARSKAAETEIARMQGIYGKDFVAPTRTDYTNGVNPVNQGSVGTQADFNSNTNVNTNVNGALSGVNQVNQNVGGYDPTQANQYAQAAYKSQMALAAPQWAQADQAQNNDLALRGLSAGSEAQQRAVGVTQSTRALQQNALLNQSYASGNDSARADYATQLAGVQAGNAAQQQSYAQGINNFNTGNSAQQSQFQKDLATYGARENQLRTNSGLQAGQNAAQQQAYQQAMGTYSTDMGAALQARNQPVNEMNALLHGQQIGSPTFGNYATQQTTPGADSTGAYNSWLSGANASNNAAQAASAANTSAAAGVIGSGLAAYGAYAGAASMAF